MITTETIVWAWKLSMSVLQKLHSTILRPSFSDLFYEIKGFNYAFRAAGVSLAKLGHTSLTV